MAAEKPAKVSRRSPAALAMPKSMMRMLPSSQSMMFSGFRSRWMMSWRCRYSRRLADAGGDASGVGHRQPAHAPHHLPQRLALEKLHHDVGPALLLLDGQHVEDVGVVEPLADLLFPLKTRVESRGRSRIA